MKKSPEKFPIQVKSGSVTVKIYRGKTRGYPVFTLSWYEGRTRMRRTFANFEEAKAEAESFAKKLESGHRTAATMRNPDAEEWALAKAELKPFKIPLNAAAKEFAEAKRILDGMSVIEAARFYMERRPTQDVAISASDAVKAFLQAKQSDGAGIRYLQ